MLTSDKLLSEIRALPDADKLRVVDAILGELHNLDPEIERVCAEEARERWAAYKEGRIGTTSYEDVIAKHRDAVILKTR